MNTIKNFKYASVLCFALSVSAQVIAANKLDEAKTHIEEKDYKTAIIVLKNHLKEQSDDALARNLLGDLYLGLGEFKLAEKEIRKAYRLAPNNEDIILEYSQLLLLKKQFQQAHQLLSKPFKDPALDKKRKINQALAFLGQNQLVDAKAIFKQLQKQTANPKVRVGLAQIAILEKKYAQAINLLNEVLKTEPKNQQALIILAQVKALQGSYQDALDIYSQFINGQGNNLSFYLKRAAVLLQTNQLNRAEQDLKIILTQYSSHPAANYLMAQIRLREKNYPEAQNYAQNVLNVQERHFPAMLVLGVSHLMQGNYNQADKYLTQYLSEYPENTRVQNLLANVYLKNNRPLQALLILEAIEPVQRDRNIDVLTTMGSAYLLIGEYDKGIQWLEKARKLGPDNMEIKKRLALGQLEAGNVQQAVKSLEDIVKTDVSNKKSAYLLVMTYIQQNNLEQAQAQLDNLFKQYPNDPQLYNLLGAIEGIKKNQPAAVKAYQKAIALDKNYIPAYIGLAKVAIAREELDRARQLFEQVIAIDKSYNRAYNALAVIAEKKRDFRATEEYLRASYQYSSNKQQIIAAANLLGKWYTSKKKFVPLLALAKDLVQKYPDDKQTLSFLMAAQLWNKENLQAQNTLRKIIARFPNDTKHRLFLVSLLNKQAGNQQAILQLLDEVIKIKQNIRDAEKMWRLKINYLVQQKQADKALAEIEPIIQSHSQSALGYRLKAYWFTLHKQREQALAAYQKAYKQAPDNNTMFSMVDILMSQNQVEHAIAQLKQAIEQSPNNKGLYFKLGNVYQKIKQNQQAIVQYQQVLKLDKNNVAAMNNLAGLYFETGNKEALLMAKRAFALAPEVVEVMDTYANILIHSENRDALVEGINILERAASKKPNNKIIQQHLLQAYQKKGDIQKARAIQQVLQKKS